MGNLNQTDTWVEQTNKAPKTSKLDKQSGDIFNKMLKDTLSAAKTGVQATVLAWALSTASAHAQNPNTQTFNLENGSISITQKGETYTANAEVIGTFSKALLSKKGDALYLIWDWHEVDILNFGKYEDLWETSAEEQNFINFLKGQWQTEFLAMLTIAKREYFQKSLENEVKIEKIKKDWSYFVGINLQYSNANVKMKNTLLQVDTLAFYLDKNIDTITYYDDFEQAPTSYTPDFKRILWYIAEIAQDKAEIAQDKAEIAQDKAEIAQSKENIRQDKVEITQLDKSIAQNIAVINAYKKVMWAL